MMPRVYRFLRLYKQTRGPHNVRVYECRTCGELVGGGDLEQLEHAFGLHCMADMNCALEAP